MESTRKWLVGIAAAVVVLLTLSFGWLMFRPYGGYGMMGNNYYGWQMPMMQGGFFGMMNFGMMFFMWLISLGLLILIGLGIAWFVKALNRPK
ncbi:MAG TPA: hypothetical protein VHM28_09765 [Anaerolineales bacterium]|jgi:uncharacterized membrane protein|nr:hypothetical protein [Anaerolineales bacterium]